MLFCFPLLLYGVFLSETKGAVVHIPDSNGRSLDHYLCNSTVSHTNTVYVLQSTITHTLNNSTGPLCMIRDTTNITILSSHPSQHAVIDCDLSTSDLSHPTSAGLVFYNISDLVLTNISFTNCGGNLSDTEALQLLNQRPMVDPPVQYPNFNESFTTLLFITCPMLQLQNIELESYRGYGIIIKDVPDNAVLDSITITNAINGSSQDYYGSGLIIVHIASQIRTRDGNETVIGRYYDPPSLTLTNITITKGWTDGFNDGLIHEIDSDHHVPVIRVPAGLSLIVSEPSDHVNAINVTMNGITVYNNTGGGMLIVFINVVYSSVVLSNANVSSCLEAEDLDSQSRVGESLTVYYLVTESRPQVEMSNCSLIMRKVHFVTSKSDSCRSHVLDENIPFVFNHSAVLIRVVGKFIGKRIVDNQVQHVLLEDVLFSQDFPGVTQTDFGIGLFVHSYFSISMTLRNVTATNFSCTDNFSASPYFSCVQVGSLGFRRMVKLEVENGLFTNHTDCSVFYGQETNTYFTGNITFTDNHGVLYGAVQLVRFSRLFLQEPLLLTMHRNTALYGGALYIYEDFSINCAIQFIPLPDKHYHLDNYTDMNVELLSENNSALLSGNTIYANLLHHCGHSQFDRIPLNELNQPTLFTILLDKMDPQQNRTTKEISSPPSLICLCDDSKTLPQLPCYNASYRKRNISVHPGERIMLNMVAADGSGSVYGVVTARLQQIPSDVTVYLKQQDISSSIAAGICSEVDYYIYHNVNGEVDVTLEVAPSLQYTHTIVTLTLRGCPPGVHINNKTLTCECLLVYSTLGCSVNGSINRPDHYWVGYTKSGLYGYSYSCPSGFCNDSLTTVTINTNLNESSPMCNGGRTGTHCALCPDGRSVVFGTVECKVCSNWYIFTILLFCLCGILLVTLLFILQLTVKEGTINGVIFYANLLSTGFTSGYLLQLDSHLYLLSLFISFLNLNLGFPLCFYDGMNEEVYGLLQFVFPVYVWIIIGIIIYASKHSIKLSNLTGRHSTAVLATLIQLSYSKIMTNIAESFPYARIVTDNGEYTVWFGVGISYSSPLHILHMMISLVFLVLFIIPYTLIITLSPFLARYRIVNRFMPYLEVIYAPYKDKWRCWFGVRLCILVVLLAFRSALRGYSFRINLGIQLVTVMAFTLCQVHYKPFKNRFIHALDVFYMINFSLSAFLSISVNSGETLFVIIVILKASAFIVFMGILAYHIHLSYCKEGLPSICKLPCRINRDSAGKDLLLQTTSSYISINDDRDKSVSLPPPSLTHYDQYREPVLEYYDDNTSNNRQEQLPLSAKATNSY